MTKREKILLQICVALALIGLTTVYLYKPSLDAKKEKAAELEKVKVEELNINTVLEAEGVDEKLEEQRTLAAENYKYFYDKLNTYTIDRIINDRVTFCRLTIESMHIGEYEEIGTDILRRTLEARTGEKSETVKESEKEKEEEQQNLLLGCRVSLNVRGTYSQVLMLIDSLRRESTCIEVTSVELHMDERSVETNEATEASLGLLVYGVNDTMLKEDAE